MSATSLTLYDLSRELVELMDRYDDPELLEVEHAEIEAKLRVYAAQHVRKVDDIRAYLRHCELMIDGARREVAIQKAHEEAWEARRDRLKALCVDVMQEFKAKRLDGNTGSLLLRGNGGKQPVTIANPELVPDEFCVYECSISGQAFGWLRSALGPHITDDERSRWEYWSGRQDVQIVRTPRKSLIEAELQKPCQVCEGRGWMPDTATIVGATASKPCDACGGSGKRGVPGCTLEPRGVHLEVK